MAGARASLVRLLAALAVAAALALGGGAGCASLSPDYLEVPFFFEYDPDPLTLGDGERTTIPILLSGHWDRPDKDEERLYVLFPLFSAVREGREEQVSLLYAPIYNKRIDHRGFEDFDIIAGPVLYGHSADEGRYLAVLPFGGVLKGFLGKDYAVSVTPFFWYLEERTTAGLFKSWHAPFPFINVVSGGGRKGFRVWPLFAHYERWDAEGRQAYDRTWILWPFWQTLRNNMNTEQGEQWMWFLFPFVGMGGGPHHDQWTVLYPFFHYFERRTTSFGAGYDPYWEVKAPFPFFIYGKGKNRYRFDLWPFFGMKERALPLAGGDFDRFERRFVLGPLYRWEHHENAVVEDTKWWLMPLVWKYSRLNKETGRYSQTFKLWPLLRVKQREDGSTTVNLISPLWFDWFEDSAFEQIYNPLTRVYERDRTADGGDRLRLLWGLYSSLESAERDDLAVHPLFWDDETKDGREHHLGLLFGLFQYVRRGNQKALRFFWLPEWPSWEDEEMGPYGEDLGEGAAP